MVTRFVRPAPASYHDASMTGTAYIYTSGSDSPEIRVQRFDPRSGALTPLHTVDAGPGSGYLAFARDGKHVYAINRKPSRVNTYAVERQGALRKLNQVTLEDPVFGATHLAVHPAGRWLAVAHFLSGHVSVHPLADGDGTVGPAVEVKETGREAHQAVFTADGRFLFVPCRAGDVVCQFAIDASTGKLTPNDPFLVRATPGAGPRHMAIHPSQRFAFLLNELDGTLTSYRLDPQRGLLSEPETVSNVPPGFTERAAAHVEVHPGGRFVYASNRQHNSIAVWSFDPDQRLLQSRGHETAGGRIRAPRDFTLDRDGELLLSVNQADDLLLAFRIQPDGTLRPFSEAHVQQGPTFVGILPATDGG
jgi:6-phosphogluconolactonase